MNEKLDRRVVRTRSLLQTAILGLVVEKLYDQITIEEITERANLGRTTFYLHYTDKKELLLASVSQVMDDLFSRIYTDENWKRWEEERIDPRRMVFAYVSEKADLWRRLFQGEIGGLALHHFQQRLADIFIQITINWQQKLNLTPLLPNQITNYYAAGAFTGLLVWWLENDMPYPADDLYEMYHQMMVNGVSQSIGFSPEHLGKNS